MKEMGLKKDTYHLLSTIMLFGAARQQRIGSPVLSRKKKVLVTNIFSGSAFLFKTLPTN
jgi:hypothetical protein